MAYFTLQTNVNQGYQNEAELSELLKTHNLQLLGGTDQELYYCDICNEEIQSEVELKNHLEFHEQDPNYIPHFCFIGNSLPTIWDCVSTIWRLSPTIGSEKQNQITNALSIALLEHWKIVFPKNFLIQKSYIKGKIEKSIKAYAKIKNLKLDRAEKIHEFRLANNVILDLIKTDVRKNLERLPVNLMIFYNDQCGPRRMSFDDIETIDLQKINENSIRVASKLVESTESQMLIEEKSSEKKLPEVTVEPPMENLPVIEAEIKFEFPCPECGQGFEIEADFQKHFKAHLEDSPSETQKRKSETDESNSCMKKTKPQSDLESIPSPNPSKTITEQASAKPVEAEPMKITCDEKCTNNCWNNISEFKRQKVHEFFWNLDDSKKLAFIDFSVKEKEDKAKNLSLETETNRMQKSREYSLTVNGTKHIVCSTFFVQTLGITRRKIDEFFKEKSSKEATVNKKLEQDQLLSEVIQHIESYPKVSCPAKDGTENLHFAPGVSIVSMYKAFKEKSTKLVSFGSFVQIYQSKYEMSLFFSGRKTDVTK